MEQSILLRPTLKIFNLLRKKSCQLTGTVHYTLYTLYRRHLSTCSFRELKSVLCVKTNLNTWNFWQIEQFYSGVVVQLLLNVWLSLCVALHKIVQVYRIKWPLSLCISLQTRVKVPPICSPGMCVWRCDHSKHWANFPPRMDCFCVVTLIIGEIACHQMCLHGVVQPWSCVEGTAEMLPGINSGSWWWGTHFMCTTSEPLSLKEGEV